MSYNSSFFLFLFLPAVLICYQLAPKRYRGVVLIFFSYLFFWSFSNMMLVYLIGTTFLVHHITLWLNALRLEESQAEDKVQKKKCKRDQKRVLVVGIGILLGILGILKYHNFFMKNISLLAAAFSLQMDYHMVKWMLPIGISFYTLEAVGYMADAYWGRIPQGRSFQKTALFLSFFPTIMEGPICRYKDVEATMFSYENLDWDNLTSGALRILWGLFKKMVIADRLAIAVATVFDFYFNYSGFIVLFGAVCYTMQLYMEFSGVMDIVIGCGRMFGIGLPENFRQPFFARTVTDFWRRWHITLGVWFKEYIFFPVSLSHVVKKWNKYGKKHFGKFITGLVTSGMALFPVWLSNGIWHGAKWSYIFYGMYYFTLIILGLLVEPLRDKLVTTLHLNVNAWYYRIPQTLKMLVIIFTGELFFRSNGLRTGIYMFLSIFRDFHISTLWDGTLLTLGIDAMDYLAAVVGLVIVFIVGVLREKQVDIIGNMMKLRLPVRWAIYYAMIFAVLIFGAYGDGYQPIDLIYAGF